MDPFSITCGVAGIATAAASLAKGLYNLITDVHDATEETAAILAGLSDVSLLLDEARHVVKARQGVFRDDLLRGIKSLSQRIMLYIDKMRQLATVGNRIDRLLWTVRRKEASRLLETISRDKETLVQLTVMGVQSINGRTRLSQQEPTSKRDKRRSVEDGEAYRQKQVYQHIHSASKSILSVVLPQERARHVGKQTIASCFEHPLHADAAGSDIKEGNSGRCEQGRFERLSCSSKQNIPRLHDRISGDLEADLGSIGSVHSNPTAPLAEATSRSLLWFSARSIKLEKSDEDFLSGKNDGPGLDTKGVIEDKSRTHLSKRPPVATRMEELLAVTRTLPSDFPSITNKRRCEALFPNLVVTIIHLRSEPRRNVAFQVQELKERLYESMHHGSQTNQLNLREKIRKLEEELKECAMEGKAQGDPDKTGDDVPLKSDAAGSDAGANLAHRPLKSSTRDKSDGQIE